MTTMSSSFTLQTSDEKKASRIGFMDLPTQISTRSENVSRCTQISVTGGRGITAKSESLMPPEQSRIKSTHKTETFTRHTTDIRCVDISTQAVA